MLLYVHAAGERLVRDVRLRCGRAALSLEGLACHDADLRVAGKRIPAVFDLELNLRSGRTHLAAALGQGGRVDVLHEDDGSVRAALAEVPAESLLALLQSWSPEIARAARDVKPVGRASGEIDWTQAGVGVSRLGVRLRLAGAGFGTADGLRAAENIDMALAVDARQAGDTWHWQTKVDWQQGAAYLHPLYLEAGPKLSARGRLDGKRVRVEHAELELEGVRRLSATATTDLDALDRASISLAFEGADLARVGAKLAARFPRPAINIDHHLGNTLYGEADETAADPSSVKPYSAEGTAPPSGSPTRPTPTWRAPSWSRPTPRARG